MEDGSPVVDMDLHVADHAAALAPYVALPWRHAVEQAEQNPPWTLNGTTHPYRGPRRSSRPLESPEAAASALEAEAADWALLLPSGLLNLGALPTAHYATACARAYNRWLADHWLDADDRFRGGLLIAPQDPAAAADDIEAAAGTGLSVVVIPVTGLDPLLGDRRYDPIYEAAQRHGFTIVVHCGGELQIPSSPFRLTMFANQFEQLAMSRPLLAMAHLTMLVGTGVLARYPDVRFLFLGAGATWLTHLALRMDKEYSENRRDVPHYRDRISFSLARQVGVGTNPWPGATTVDVPSLLDAGYRTANVVYGSGLGTGATDLPGDVASSFHDPKRRRAVMGGNAVALLERASAGSDG